MELTQMNTFLFLFEITGTIAFAFSGAISAIHKGMDLFGVLMLGIITATAGGVMRDIILGSFPPSAFIHPIYVGMAALTSLAVFIVCYCMEDAEKTLNTARYKRILLICDSIGLGVFTVNGMSTAISRYGVSNGFLVVFSGVMTGVGGGVLRDMMLGGMPVIFRKQVYALASIIGAVAAWVLFLHEQVIEAELIGSMLVFLIRMMAAHYRWSLPRIERDER
jgi:uncharacterized membrane protein YeiH